MGTTAVPAIPLPDPPLTDGVVTLRPFRAADVDHVLALWADPAVVRWTGVPARPSPALAAAWIAGRDRHRRHGRGLDLVVEDPTGTALGAVSLDDPAWEAGRIEAGYSVLAAHRRRGVARRALALLSSFALAELRLTGVELRIDAANAASARVAVAAGFVEAGPAGEEGLRRWRRPAGPATSGGVADAGGNGC